MKLKEYQGKEEMLSAIREEAIDMISCIINDWDEYTNKNKVSAINGVLNFLAGLEVSLLDAEKEN